MVGMISPLLRNRVDLFDKNWFGSENTYKQIMIMYNILDDSLEIIVNPSHDGFRIDDVDCRTYLSSITQP